MRMNNDRSGRPSGPLTQLFVTSNAPKIRHDKKIDNPINEAGYTAIVSRTVGQEHLCENRSDFKNVTTRQGVESRARLKMAKKMHPVTCQFLF